MPSYVDVNAVRAFSKAATLVPGTCAVCGKAARRPNDSLCTNHFRSYTAWRASSKWNYLVRIFRDRKGKFTPKHADVAKVFKAWLPLLEATTGYKQVT